MQTIKCLNCKEQQPTFLSAGVHTKTHHHGEDVGLPAPATCQLWGEIQIQRRNEFVERMEGLAIEALSSRN